MLARHGIASRRAAEGLLKAGRVRVDGRPVTTPGEKVDPATSRITVNGRELRRQTRRTFLLNKPRGFVCSSVPQGELRTVVDLFARVRERLFTAGRLDEDSEGLLVVTNDGDLAEALTHPRYEVTKTYRVTVSGQVPKRALEQLCRGVHLAERKTLPAKVRVARRGKKVSTLEITVREGANREVRRICARVGLAVKRLVRTRIGRLRLARIPKGAYRALTNEERVYCDRLRQRVIAGRTGRNDDTT